MTRSKGSRNKKFVAGLMFLLSTVLRTTYGLCLSMVASGRPASDSFRNPLRSAGPFRPEPTRGVTSSLISQLAVLALKLRLTDYADVSCDVQAKSSDLMLRGEVGPVTVKGRGWRSGLGLTCRAIDATVDLCQLDATKILSNRKLVLITPAKGKAMVALTSADFGNFITHPLMRPPALPQSASSDSPKLEFIKSDTDVDPNTGTVTFFVVYNNSKWKCMLRRGTSEGMRAVINVLPAEQESTSNAADVSDELSAILSKFFNEMDFELDGTFLSFQDMMLTDKGQSPSVMLKLNLLVKKFPSPGLAF